MVKLLTILQKKMEIPEPWGWYHILWILIICFTLMFLNKRHKDNNEKELKLILGIYSIGTIILELVKQIIWTFSYNVQTNSFLIDYQWYAFPFQFCTTPMFVCFLCLFMKKSRLRDAFLSYIAFFTIIGSIATILMPESCFVNQITVNIHTMWLHCGSLIVSIYLLMSKFVTSTKQNYIDASFIFIGFILMANILNIVVYNSSFLDGEMFNMFYISPYFKSSLPVFSTIQSKVPYLVFLLTYFGAIEFGAYIVYSVNKFIIRKKSNKKHSLYT